MEKDFVRSACGTLYPLFEGATFIVVKSPLPNWEIGEVFTYTFKYGEWQNNNRYSSVIRNFYSVTVAPYNLKEISLEDLL